jgi:signal transduction histidine kinase
MIDMLVVVLLHKRSLTMGQSEIALLRQKIVEEYEAMKRGLTGLALGTAQHAFIDARMKRVEGYHEQLAQCVGEQKANLAICELYVQVIG